MPISMHAPFAGSELQPNNRMCARTRTHTYTPLPGTQSAVQRHSRSREAHPQGVARAHVKATAAQRQVRSSTGDTAQGQVQLAPGMPASRAEWHRDGRLSDTVSTQWHREGRLSDRSCVHHTFGAGHGAPRVSLPCAHAPCTQGSHYCALVHRMHIYAPQMLQQQGQVPPPGRQPPLAAAPHHHTRPPQRRGCGTQRAACGSHMCMQR
jgi:hypothetical protein